jgi:hypothetical protein
MNRERLAEILYRIDVPSDLYRLDGSHFELAHVLAERNSGWVVFLSERGTESDVAQFASEREACIDLFGRICLDLVERNQLRVAPPESQVAP